jgi:hypothetical protein
MLDRIPTASNVVKYYSLLILLPSDLIEKGNDNKYRLAEPIMGAWVMET